MPKLKAKSAKRRPAKQSLPRLTPDGHISPKRVALGPSVPGGVVLGFELPGKKLATFRIDVDDALWLLSELPMAIEEASGKR